MSVTSAEDKASNSQDNLSSAQAAEVLPRRFERYTLLRHIARGGMGEVYLATCSGIEGAERPCVIKIIRREHAEDRSFLARFLDEARIQAQLHHPGVAQILEASTDAGGKPYVVVEYIEGRNLGEVRQRAAQLGARINWPDAVAVAVCIADALAHVHERTDASGTPLDIVHRDLSPQNVMVGYAGDVKLIDFGTARGQNRRCQTIAGVVFAKPGYVAPEVANNTPGGAPADIYAVGVMLWELVAGRRFLSGDASEHVAAVASGQRNPSSISQLVDAPRELDTIIARMTASRIQDRYASAREATMDLVMLLKRAPSLADGERSVRGRISQLMQKLYPAEPTRSRAEFAKLVAAARSLSPMAAPTGPERDAGALEPGLLAGTRYRIVHEIGRGAMGVVYEAYHLDLARTVALKVLPSDALKDEQKLERFRAEARAIARLHHDNLVRLHDFGSAADGQPYFAMELLDGETLEAHLARERGMDYRDALKLGVQACGALEAAHAVGLVHRDIKPANLFLTRSGTLKLLDFGISQPQGESAAQSPTHSPAVSMVGTPEYMAPEQTPTSADARCDLYSLGVVLYELVTGRRPHDGDSTVSLLDAKLNHAPERPSKAAPQRGLPPSLDSVLLRALATDPAERMQSAAELRAALESVLEQSRGSGARRRRRALTAFAAVALVLGVGVTAIGRPGALANARTALSAGSASKPQVSPLEPTTGLVAARIEEAVVSAGERAEAPAPALPASDAPVVAAAAGDADAAEEGDTDGEEEAALEPPPAAADDAPAQTEAKLAAGDAKSAEVTLETRIQSARELMAAGKELRGFHQLRYLGRSNYGDAQALRAWSEAAAQVKAWGEAARTARRWAAIDPSTDALIHLARMERAVGRRGRAVSLLKKIVRSNPEANDAKQLLASFGWDPERLAKR